MSEDLKQTKDHAGKVLVGAGATAGAVVGAQVVAAAAANVAAATAATATSATLASTFSAFGLQAVVTNPGTWAVLATNPIGQAVLICGGGAVGAFSLYKVAKKLLA
jgi:hypothetical protein